MEVMMELTRIVGILIAVGFVVFWIGNLYSPPRVYQESSLEVRLQTVSEYPGRWAVSQGLGGVGIGIMVLGLLILSVYYAVDNRLLLTYLPAVLNIVAVVLVSIWLYQYITDPASIWGSSVQSPLMLGATVLMAAAGILYGILFLQIGLTSWLSYLTIGYGAVALVAILVARPPAFVVISLYFFVLLADAVGLYLL
jgi:hypothetical protein